MREPSCADWDLLLDHLRILDAGHVCYTPRPDWSLAGKRIGQGGAIPNGAGRKMLPSHKGYIIPGTHAYSLGRNRPITIRVFIETPEIIIASRLAGRAVSEKEMATVLREHLNDNLLPLRALHHKADLMIDGRCPHASELQTFRQFLSVAGKASPR